MLPNELPIGYSPLRLTRAKVKLSVDLSGSQAGVYDVGAFTLGRLLAWIFRIRGQVGIDAGVRRLIYMYTEQTKPARTFWMNVLPEDRRTALHTRLFIFAQLLFLLE